MSEHPEKITQKYLDGVKDISSETIKIDIKDTEEKIERLSLEIQGLELQAKAHRGTLQAKMPAYLASGKRLKREDMEGFILHLRKILTAREEGVKMFVLDLDEEFLEDVFREIEKVQDGKKAHEAEMDTESAGEAAKELLLRLIPCFEENFYERESDN